MAYASDFVGLLLKQTGDRYDYGVNAADTDPDPNVFDCSELVRWGCARLGVRPIMPDGSWLQYQHCHQCGTVIPLSDAVRTTGALLFRFSSSPMTRTRPKDAHVAVSVGNGSTIEAKGKAYGVGSWSTAGRSWTHAGRVPGLSYTAPPAAPPVPGKVDTSPPWPGRYFMNPPRTQGRDVTRWQERMLVRGNPLVVDGIYGPASQEACRHFQEEQGLTVDGIVGAQTWRAAWAAPVLGYPRLVG